ncbi:hypothetical protein GYMLUDRAFT_241463 [Collybiopsis luxurians FD-317 M1]|uniref:Unplaced genomic scaffold GYMLUscaffold_15, whole genome shotgun sequence n=1 Tax=Collybiopsis luxurians FD-317 M1 TaxID=944289 RepID=A0A0D0C623_9AGAR|nr:hypothetical protein GYMLUDRAFT_241463 [Collybiopsis luxurians FD-317 M1]
MARKRYSYPRRIILIPSIFLFILFIQHLFFTRYHSFFERSNSLSQKIQILGQWKQVRRELELPIDFLPDEITIQLEPGDSSYLLSRLFKRSLTAQPNSNVSPEQYFSLDALDEPKISYDELRKSLRTILMAQGEQGLQRKTVGLGGRKRGGRIV